MNVFVAAFGYFVDIFDLYLFSILRINSLKDLNVSQEQLLAVGIKLLNYQMAGLLIGGVLWGMLGDKRGRINVLFGSIALYSLGNILNGFVSSVEMYAVLRFISGIGLAGELGAAVTLVSEILPKEKRGYGTTIVASVGLSGSIAAAFTAEYFSWRVCYWIGGGLGLLLLSLRFQLRDSWMFHQAKYKGVSRGNFLMLFKSRERFFRYLRLIVIGLPIWFCGGILFSLSPELAKEIGVQGDVTVGKTVFFSYIGVAIGDLVSGLYSQWIRSRKKALFGFVLLTAWFIGLYLFVKTPTLSQFYMICTGVGFATGYWAVLMVTSAEQFGTNIRATATTSIPNFIRGAVVPITLLFLQIKPSMGAIWSAALVGAGCVLLSLFSVLKTEESFSKDLNFVEED